MSKDLKVILGIVAAALVGMFLWYVKTIIIYILVSGVLALIGLPLKRMLQKAHVGRVKLGSSISAALTLLLMISFIALFGRLFIPVIAEQVEIISSLDVNRAVRGIVDAYDNIKYSLTQVETHSTTDRQEISEKLLSVLDFSGITDVFTGVAGVLGNIFIAFFSIIFITFFFLKDFRLFKQLFFVISPSAYEEKVQSILSNAKNLLTRYFIGVIIQVSSIALLVTIGLSIFGVENALFIGFFAGLINVIPYVGPVIGSSFGMLLAISGTLHFEYSPEFWPFILKVGTVFLIVQMLDNFVFQPLIFSNSVKAHPLEIFIVILTAGTVGGILGMILAIPFYTMLRIIAKEFLSQFKIVQSLTRNM